MSEQRARDPTAKRALWLVVVALPLAAAALWGSSELTWFAEYRDVGPGGVGSGGAGPGGTALYTASGAQRTPALVPLALLALAGVAGVVATGGWPRRLLGGVLVLAGVGVGVIGVTGTELSGGADYPTMSILAGHGLAVVGGLLLALGGVVGVRMAARMPRLGARYAAPGGDRTVRDPDTELWDSLSAGEDPTTSE